MPGTVQSEEFDIGANGSAFYIPNNGVPDPEEKPADVNLEDSGDGSLYVSSTSGGQWMNYTVNIAQTRSYTFEARVSSVNSGNTFHVEVDGVDKTGPILIPNTGAANVFNFVSVEDIFLDAGQRMIRLVVDGSGANKGNFDYFTISPYDPVVYCNPDYWELESCHMTGGYWDYDLCACNYGPLGY